MKGLTFNRLQCGASCSQESINKLFTTFICLGPVPRTCLDLINVTSNEAYNASLEPYLREVDREIEAFIAKGGRETIAHTVDHNASHHMAIICPTGTGYSYTAQIITRWIAYRFYEKAMEHSPHDCFLLFKHLSRQSSLRTAAGWFFEGYVHDWLRSGGTFEADQIPILEDHTSHFQFHTVKDKSSSPNYFTTPATLAEQVKGINGHGMDPEILQTYFLPFSCNYQSVDGLMFPDPTTLILFQITLARHHEIKAPGVVQLLQALPETIKNLYFVFIVSEERAEDYARAQRVPDQVSFGTRGQSLCLKQFRVVFGDESMQSVAVRGVV